jgi:hypothetical protein
MVNREQDGTSALDRYLLIIGETLEKGERPGFGYCQKAGSIKTCCDGCFEGAGTKGVGYVSALCSHHLDRERPGKDAEGLGAAEVPGDLFLSWFRACRRKESKEEALQVGLHVSEKLFKRMIAYIDFLEDCPAKKISWEKDLAGICEDPD